MDDFSEPPTGGPEGKIEDSLSFSPPLHNVQLLVPKPIPVVVVGRKIGGLNFAREVALDVLCCVGHSNNYKKAATPML